MPTVYKTTSYDGTVRRTMYHSPPREVRDGSYDWDNPRLAGGGDVYDDATQFHTNYYLLNCEEEEERLVVAIITTRMLSFRLSIIQLQQEQQEQQEQQQQQLSHKSNFY